MKLIQNRRVRTVLIAGTALAVVAAVGVGVAQATSTTSSRWVTATAATGNVTQTSLLTGSITRKNTAVASFAATGTVNSVKVAVGDQVGAGQVLATLDTRSLKLAVLEAETSLARADLTLYTAQHPASTSSGTAKASKDATVSVSIDLAGLNKAVSRVNAAVPAEAKACDAVLAWVNSSVGSARTASATDSDAASASAAPTASAATVTPTTSANDPSEAQLKACASARVELSAANANLASVMAAANKAAGGGSKPSTGSGSGSKAATVSASAVASAKAGVLQAEQKLQSAKDDLADAELLAPISGTVGVVNLEKGDDAANGSITIVGSGAAVVSIEVPLKVRGSLVIGTTASVTPAGSQTALQGKVTAISALETSGTSGDSPTYTTTISVSDPDGRLASGAKAAVSIPVKAVSSVVTVPVSAVTPTGTGTGTVQVLAAGSQTPTTVAVKTGAIGAGLAEITEGLSAAQVVVLADRSAAIPSNTGRGRTTSTSKSTTSSASAPSAAPAGAPQPSASASR